MSFPPDSILSFIAVTHLNECLRWSSISDRIEVALAHISLSGNWANIPTADFYRYLIDATLAVGALQNCKRTNEMRFFKRCFFFAVCISNFSLSHYSTISSVFCQTFFQPNFLNQGLLSADILSSRHKNIMGDKICQERFSVSFLLARLRVSEYYIFQQNCKH